MEELLSLDDEVLQDVYTHWAPPNDDIIRIPPLLWARLREDMRDFIMNRQVQHAHPLRTPTHA
jgi:hypothetical protein